MATKLLELADVFYCGHAKPVARDVLESLVK